MKTIETRFVRGPNIYSNKPIFKAIIDLEDLDDVASTALPGFSERLCALIPSLDKHRCSYGTHGGFVRRLHDGTYMAHIVEHVMIELQVLAGTRVGFGKARSVKGSPRLYTVICAYVVESVAARAFVLAMDLVQALARGPEPEFFAEGMGNLKDLASRDALGPSTMAILEAARKRGIPAFRLTERAGLFQLGTGKLQKRIQASITSNTSHIAVKIASDKQLTKDLLRSAGIPVPCGYTVQSYADALEAAARLRCPFTVKPLDANHGKGVHTRVTLEGLAAAFEVASEYSKSVIIEDYVNGDDFRVLVTGGVVVAASRRSPPCVKGDGVSTIAQLVERENAQPRRGDGHSKALSTILIDRYSIETLKTQGYTPESVPSGGLNVTLRGNANLSTGGTAEDVTELLHPQTQEICIRAARTIGLDVAGIDLICRDIRRPLLEQAGAVIEINAAPGIRMHEYPSGGTPRDAGDAIVESLFMESDGRIPIIAVTGTNGKTTTTLAIEHVIRATGAITGIATSEGVRVNGQELIRGDCSGYVSARTVLSHPDTEVAVLEVARGGIVKRGLGFDMCDIAVVLNISNDHLGQDGVHDIDELARVKRVVAASARKAVVLNADDARCVAMQSHIRDGTEIVFFSMTETNAVIYEHLEQGGRAVYNSQGTLTCFADGKAQVLARVEDIPFTLQGAARHNVANALASMAALTAAGYSTEVIVNALRSFTSDSKQNPLRMNFTEIEGVPVLVDYAHNLEAYAAILDTARSLTKGRLVGVITAPGNRRDEELLAVGAICAQGLDEIIIYEMDDLRGRPAGYAARAIHRGIAESGIRVGTEHIHDVRAALATAIDRCGPTDMVLLGSASHVEDVAAATRIVRDIRARRQASWKSFSQQSLPPITEPFYAVSADYKKDGVSSDAP